MVAQEGAFLTWKVRGWGKGVNPFDNLASEGHLSLLPHSASYQGITKSAWIPEEETGEALMWGGVAPGSRRV